MKKTHLLIDCCLLRECIYLFFLFIAPFSCPSTYIWKPAVSLCYKNIEETYKFSEGDVNCTMAGGRLAILNTQEKLMSVKDGKYIISKPITQIFLNWYVFMFKKKNKKKLMPSSYFSWKIEKLHKKSLYSRCRDLQRLRVRVCVQFLHVHVTVSILFYQLRFYTIRKIVNFNYPLNMETCIYNAAITLWWRHCMFYWPGKTKSRDYTCINLTKTCIYDRYIRRLYFS